jgi:hypothetical protein
MRVPQVQFTVRRMIGVISIVALILALVIQSERAARLERQLAEFHEGWRGLLSKLRAARETITALRKLHSDDAREVIAAREFLDSRSRVHGPPKGKSPGAERVPSGRGRDRPEPPSPGPVK